MSKLTKEQFVLKARQTHGWKYDYSLVDYKKGSEKIKIICPIHGVFEQRASAHLRGDGCPNCAGVAKLNNELFIIRARKVHGNKYDYSKVDYKNLKGKVNIVCPIHGTFEQRAGRHLEGDGCPKCSHTHMDIELFIECAKQRHGDKYDYSKVIYKNSITPVKIVCPIHGVFEQKPVNHLRGSGCPKCVPSWSDTDEFIKKAQKIHGDKYDYSKVNYKDNQTDVCIICPEHGEFMQTPQSHLSGSGCQQCARQKIGDRNRLTSDEFILKAKEIHGDKYDYSRINYKTNLYPIKIICKKHGEFEQIPNNHLRGSGCPKCAPGYVDTDIFIENAKKRHGDKYDYSKVNYIDTVTEVCIICPEHGEFLQKPRTHLRAGCPMCAESHLERNVRVQLRDNNIQFVREESLTKLSGKRMGRGLQKIDFFVPNTNICIECQGVQHFTPSFLGMTKDAFDGIVNRDIFKYVSLVNAGYDVIYFVEKKNSKYCKKGWYADKKVFYDVNSIVKYIKDKKSENGDDGNTVVCYYGKQLELNFDEYSA